MNFIKQHRQTEKLLASLLSDNVDANTLAKAGLRAEELEEVKAAASQDIDFMFTRDPSVKSVDEIKTYTSMFAITAHRIANIVPDRILARQIAEYAKSVTGADIHPGATIGVPFAIDHGMGVAIGETAVIGKNCMLYHGVTLGATAPAKNSRAQAGKKRHPTLGDNVVVYCNSTIIGDITIPDGTIVGGHKFIK